MEQPKKTISLRLSPSMNENLPLVVANLKANLTWGEVSLWLDRVSPVAENFSGTVIFCPSHPFLAAAAEKITSSGLKIKLGSQDISQFQEGAYTGEVASAQLKGIVGYSIIGHSERRKHFEETDEDLGKKVANAKSANLKVIFCVQDENTSIPNGVDIVAYEPIFAIASGTPDTGQNIKTVTEKLRGRGSYKVLYGGSVSQANAAEIMKTAQVDGFLVGATNSLDPQKFAQILETPK